MVRECQRTMDCYFLPLLSSNDHSRDLQSCSLPYGKSIYEAQWPVPTVKTLTAVNLYPIPGWDTFRRTVCDSSAEDCPQ